MSHLSISISPADSNSCSTREKYSGVSERRDRGLADQERHGHAGVRAVCFAAVLVARQVADHTLQPAVQRVGLHVGHQAVQAARDAGGRMARHFPKKKPPLLVALKMLAEWTGLEPATPGVTGRYSNQLNYHSM